MFVLLLLVQLFKFKIIRIAACFLVVESIDAHVGFLHLLGSIVKRGGGVLHGCSCPYHIGSEDSTVRAFKALRLYLKYLAHKHSVFKFIIYNCSCFLPKQRIIYFQGAKIMQTSAMKAAFKLPSAANLLQRLCKPKAESSSLLECYAEVQLIFCKVKENLRTKQVHNGS